MLGYNTGRLLSHVRVGATTDHEGEESIWEE